MQLRWDRPFEGTGRRPSPEFPAFVDSAHPGRALADAALSQMA